ncbi:NAD(P)/FAD-dependent oxidoreductase [Isosphaeraceae bacterium EP7]
MAKTSGPLPRVIIVGGGFGGIAAAKALARQPVDVVLLDQRNYHLFQPLLYQVATAALSPADIASPIRHILSGQRNCRVVMARVEGVDTARGVVDAGGSEVEYDWLILAAGATHSYFGNRQWEEFAPGLKTLEDATEIRKRILLAFESAEYEGSEEERRAALTFAIVGGGPTGVELAGAIKEIAAQSIPADFRNIDTGTTRVVLFQGADRLLPGFAADLGDRAKRDLEKIGIEVRLNARVTDINARGVTVGDEFLPVRNVIWAAGVQANPLARSLGVPLDQSGRVLVNPDLTVPGAPRVFVVGDLAAVNSANDGKPVPGVAQGAIQMGRYAGEIIAAEVKAGTERPRKPFSYWDKGSMATIGKGRAVAEIGRFHLGGLIAWLLWALIHVAFLVNFRNKLAVLWNWAWQMLTSARGARLITGTAAISVKLPLPDDRVHARAGDEAGRSL